MVTRSQIGEVSCVCLRLSCSSVFGAAWLNSWPLPFFPRDKISLEFFFTTFLLKFYLFLAEKKGERTLKNTMKWMSSFLSTKIKHVFKPSLRWVKIIIDSIETAMRTKLVTPDSQVLAGCSFFSSSQRQQGSDKSENQEGTMNPPISTTL